MHRSFWRRLLASVAKSSVAKSFRSTLCQCARTEQYTLLDKWRYTLLDKSTLYLITGSLHAHSALWPLGRTDEHVIASKDVQKPQMGGFMPTL